MSTASAKKMARTKTSKTPNPTSHKELKCPDAPLRRFQAVGTAIIAARRFAGRNLTAAFQAVAPPLHRGGVASIVATQATMDAAYGIIDGLIGHIPGPMTRARAKILREARKLAVCEMIKKY